MQKPVAQRLTLRADAFTIPRQVLIVFGASVFVALCARLSLPLPFTPIPLTLQNFAVLVVGLLLGSKRGFAALALYLAQGATGLPVFAPSGPGGVAQLLGPTGGYLMAYPVVAFVAGWIAERGAREFKRALLASVVAELVLFACGITWLMALAHVSFLKAANFGLYPFVFGEVIKVMSAAGIASRFHPAKRIQ
ncbi:MAG: biotin transporter BioY [Terriglobales bacterium]